MTTEATTEATAEETTEETTDETTETTEETTEASTEDTTEEDLSDLPTAEELDAQIKDEEDALETKDETATVTGTAKSGDAVIVGFAGFPLDEGSLEDQAPDIDGYTFNGGITLDGVEVSKIYSEVETKTECREYSIRIDGSDEDATTEAADEGSVAPEKAKEETVTRDVVTEKTKVTKAETANGTITISGDQSVVFTYDEDHTTTTLTAKYVDEFGDPIDKDQESVSVPFAEDKDEITLKDSFPEKLQVAQDDSGKKVKEYTYESTYIRENGEKVNITAIKRVKTDDGYAYQVKKDGSDDYTELESDTTLYVEYNDGQKSEYTYSDVNVTVTATLQHANAIPDDARFIVTQITPSTDGYNYDAYMDAMRKVNPNSDASNTLLYDIAFLGYAVDADGNTDTSKTIEYQPVEGSVNVNVSFKKNQLADKLGVTDDSQLIVAHLPLKENVKKSTDTTKSATNISSSDIEVENIDANVSLSGTDSASFTLSSFSTIGYSADAFKTDLNKFLTDVTFTGVDVGTDGSLTVLPNQDYTAAFTFDEIVKGTDSNYPGGLQFSTDRLVYTLPAGLTIDSNVEKDITVTIKEGNSSFDITGNKYTVSSDGHLYLDWNKADPNYSKLEQCENVSLNLEFSAKFSSSVKDRPMVFGDKVTKTIHIKETDTPTINKSVTFDKKDQKAHYDVTIWGGNSGDKENIVVSDQISGSALTLNEEEGGITVTSDRGRNVDYTVNTKTSKGFQLTLAKVLENETVHIKYTADVDRTAVFGKPATTDLTGNNVTYTWGNKGGSSNASLNNIL